MAGSNDNTTEFFKNIELFSLLSQKEIKIVLKRFKKICVEKDTVLFKEGDKGDILYIVKSGKVRVLIKLPDSSERELAQSGSGDFFGEMSIFESGTRSASCVASEDSELFTLFGNDFFNLVKIHSEIAIKIMYKMLNVTTMRLQNTSGFLSDMVQWGENARKRAITDELTGLYNRRYMDDIMADQFRKAKDKNYSISLIMVDMDYFREINEKYGFKVGDQAILGVADIFKKSLRKNDIVCRYGGDEFTIILPHTQSEEAFEIAEKICKQVKFIKIPILIKENYKKLSISMGIACYPENANELKSLKELADQALYRAKEGGRNQVVCH